MNSAEICLELERRKSDGAPLGRLLTRAEELLHDSNTSFDWTGIYELYPDDVLRLGPFIGAATDHVFIAVGNGVCGAAVAERRNFNVPDVGQIDIDSHTRNAFSDATVESVEHVATWLAEAYQARDLVRRR